MRDAADTIDAWIAREAVPFDPDQPASLDAAVDSVMAALGGVELLGLGEPLHGGEAFFTLRDRLFRRLVAAHGFTAIALESSFPRARRVDAYINGGGGSYDDVRDGGFSHNFGALEANRELVEWMRSHNATADRPLRFYGFDSPTEMTGADSPRACLAVALDGLAAIDADDATARRDRIEAGLGDEAPWSNPAASFDPSLAVGRTPAAVALRVETEDLINALRLHAPTQRSPEAADRLREAVRHAEVARELLTYHAGLAGSGPNRIAELLGIRDLTMADNLAYAVERERARGGRVLAFAHNSHLTRGRAEWQLGPHALAWWPAGAHCAAQLGERYAVIGGALYASEVNGIAPAEPGTLEARLAASAGPARFMPASRATDFPAVAVAGLPQRSPATINSTYFALAPAKVADYDWLLALDDTAYARGGPPLPGRSG